MPSSLCTQVFKNCISDLIILSVRREEIVMLFVVWLVAWFVALGLILSLLAVAFMCVDFYWCCQAMMANQYCEREVLNLDGRFYLDRFMFEPHAHFGEGVVIIVSSVLSSRHQSDCSCCGFPLVLHASCAHFHWSQHHQCPASHF